MTFIPGLVRRLRGLFALVLLVFGSLGPGLPVHVGMISDAARLPVLHAVSSMPMDHPGLAGMAGMAGMSESDQAVCKLQCLGVSVALPVSPHVAFPVRQVALARVPVVLLPVPHLSGPDGPPPKLLAL